jgi:uncharacterized protein (TIGR02145 family)
MRNLYYLLIFLLCYSAYSQSFSVFGVDTTSFPTMKAKFFAFDDNGSQITNLSNSSFEVKENGQPRTVTNVSCPSPKPPTPLSSVLTVDISGSMEGSGLNFAKAASHAWINALPLGKSQCAVTSFDDKNYINQDFTTDKNKLLSAVNGLQTQGGTDYDYGLYKPLAGSLVISKAGKNKRVVVFVTDGQPNQEPQVSLIIAEANSQNCNIYSVVIGNNCPQNLKDISSQTGGKWFENINAEEDAIKAYQQILMTAQGGDPCEISWQSGISCFAGITNVELIITSLSLTANTSYQSPNNSITKLEFNPANLTFKNAIPGIKKDTTVKVTARNADFNVTNIISSNPAFTISPTSFSLPAGQSKDLKVSFTPFDSGYVYCKFTFENDMCQTKYYASGGFPGKKPAVRTLKLIHPNGGQVFVAGSDTVITWEGVSPEEKVTIEYRTDDSAPWIKLTDTATGLSYKLRVPKVSSDKYLARVTAKAGYVDNGCSNPDVQICDQYWTACNLDVETYRNGDPIPEVTDPTEWANLKTGAWCYYNNSDSLGKIYGKLYNWYAVNDQRGLAPDGYHIPSDVEWKELETCLGGSDVAGGKLKSTGTIEGGDGLWTSPNSGATNSSGFSGLPGGYRYNNGNYYYIRYYGYWWSSTEYDTTYAWDRYLNYYITSIYSYYNNKVCGFSVRVVRD